MKKRKPKNEEPLTILQDDQLERGLLAAILNNAYAFKQVRAFRMFLDDEAFTDEDNRCTWQLMKACVDDGQEVNMLNVYAQATKLGYQWDMSRYVQLQGSEGDVYLMAVTVATMGIKRQLSDKLKELLMEIEYNGSLTAEKALSEIEHLLDEVTRKVKPKTIEWMKIYNSILLDYERAANGELQRGNQCGYKLIDDKGGFERGELMVIGARTSNGKTAFALNCAVNLAKRGTPVGIFSLEMTNQQLGTRILSILTGLNSMSIKEGKLEQEEVDVMTRVDDKLPIYFDDVRTSDINVIVNNIKGMVLQHGVQVVVLDYLQLMRSEEYLRQQQIGSIAHRLEALSKQLEITIVLISQLRRNVDKDPCPQLEELKESGDIADAADSIFLLYRPEQHGEYFRYPQLSKDWSVVDIHGTAMLMCKKNRQGKMTGEQVLGFDASATRFYELSYYKTATSVKTPDKAQPKTPF